MNSIFSDRISDVPKSFIREILKVAVDKEVISFEFGNISTNMIFNDPIISIIYGVILGLNERTIGFSLLNKSKEYITK